MSEQLPKDLEDTCRNKLIDEESVPLQRIRHRTAGSVFGIFAFINQFRVFDPRVRQFRRTIPNADLTIILSAAAINAVDILVSLQILMDFFAGFPGIHGSNDNSILFEVISVGMKPFRDGTPCKTIVIIVAGDQRDRFVLPDFRFHIQLPPYVGVCNAIRIPAAHSKSLRMSEFQHGKMQTNQSGQNQRSGCPRSNQFNIDFLRMKFSWGVMLHTKISFSVRFVGTRYFDGNFLHFPFSSFLAIAAQNRSRPRGYVRLFSILL